MARLFWFKSGMMGGATLITEGEGAVILATMTCVLFAFAIAAEREVAGV